MRRGMTAGIERSRPAPLESLYFLLFFTVSTQQYSA